VGCDVKGIGFVQVGNRKYMETSGILIDTKTDSALWDLEINGKTAVCVALGKAIVGIIGVADTTKPDAAPAISALREMGVDVWMVTGDNRTTAESIAMELEIPKDRILASAMPGDKVLAIVLYIFINIIILIA
jgi:P-type Cu+ transporter